MTDLSNLRYERLQFNGSDVWCFDHARTILWSEDIIRPSVTTGLHYLPLLPVLRTLGFPSHVVYYNSMPAYGCAIEDRQQRLNGFIQYIEKYTEIREDTVFVLNGAGEGLPIMAVEFAADIANHYSVNMCYYVTGAAPHPNTFESFKLYRKDASNLFLATSTLFETHSMHNYIDFKQDLTCERPKKFHFFMGGGRIHRFLLLGLLAERDLLKHAILSYNCMGRPMPMKEVVDMMQNDRRADIYRERFPNAIKICSKTLLDLPDVSNPYGTETVRKEVMHVMPAADANIYNSTWFHVTTETSVLSKPTENYCSLDATGPCLFMTEKTYRNIANGLFGVLVGQQGLYHELMYNNYGEAMTHPDIIKCDNIENDEERMFKQVDVIQTLCEWYDSHWRERLCEFQQEDMIKNKLRWQYQDKIKVNLHKC